MLIIAVMSTVTNGVDALQMYSPESSIDAFIKDKITALLLDLANERFPMMIITRLSELY